MTRKLKNHFGVDEDLTQAINYVQNKVRIDDFGPLSSVEVDNI